MLKDDLKKLLHCVVWDGANGDSHNFDERIGPHNKIRITEMDATHLLLDPDKGRTWKCNRGTCSGAIAGVVTHLFNVAPDIHAHKMCDGIAVAVSGDRLTNVVFFDAKGGARDGVRRQLDSARCFFQYAVLVLQHLWNRQVTVEQIQYVVLATAIPMKQVIGYRSARATDPKDPRIVAVDRNGSVSINSILHVI